jgi:hypothetical protein
VSPSVYSEKISNIHPLCLIVTNILLYLTIFLSTGNKWQIIMTRCPRILPKASFKSKDTFPFSTSMSLSQLRKLIIMPCYLPSSSNPMSVIIPKLSLIAAFVFKKKKRPRIHLIFTHCISVYCLWSSHLMGTYNKPNYRLFIFIRKFEIVLFVM